ncbi:MAG TPA: SPOR domain-containing protein [Chitinophagales bacterium]|nr:SPOR domain-containing protein [Chitinophagales bacterium]
MKRLSIFIVFFIFLLFSGILPTNILLANGASFTISSAENAENNFTDPELITIVLIGAVVNTNTLQPVGGVEVELLRTDDNQRQLFVTKKDGNFYFKLEPNKKYKLTSVNSKNAENPKEINTDNKKQSEILRAVLKVIPNTTVAVAQATETTPIRSYEVIPSPNTAKPVSPSAEPADVKPETVKQILTFKIQLGVFRNPLSTKSPFYTKAKDLFGNVDTEITANGFTRYMVGNFSDTKKAREKEKQLRELGYEKAFIVSYLNKSRLSPSISPEEALKKYNNTTASQKGVQ